MPENGTGESGSRDIAELKTHHFHYNWLIPSSPDMVNLIVVTKTEWDTNVALNKTQPTLLSAKFEMSPSVSEFHITSRLLRWASGAEATNSLPHVL